MTLNINDAVTLNQSFDHSRVDLSFRIFDFLRLTDGLGNTSEEIEYIRRLAEEIYQLEPTLYNLALSEKKLVETFFKKVIALPPFSSNDSKLFEKLIIDWYASQRTLITSMKKGIDPFFMTNEEIDL